MPDKRQAPTCKKCAGVHYGFQPCGSTEATAVEREKVGTRAPLVIIENPERRGYTNWGDRLDSIMLNGKVFMDKDWKIAKRGGVVEHPDWSAANGK